MSALIRMPRAVWRRQPQCSVGPNWNHPYFSSASYGFVLHKNLYATLRKDWSIIQAGMATLVSANGVSYGILGSQSLRVTLDASPPSALPFSVINVPSPSSTSQLACSVGTNQLYYGIVGAQTAQLTLGTGGTAGPTSRRSLVFDNPKSHSYAIAAPSFDASTWYGFVNGAGMTGTSASGTGSSYAIGTAVYSLGWNTGTNAYGDNFHTFNAVSNAPLNAALLKSLSENPWQLLLKWPSRFILIPDGAGGAITLSVQDASHSQSVDTISIIQANVLSIADSLHSQSAESPLLTQAHTLAIQAADHSQTVDGELSLTQVFVLTLADSTHSQTSETPTLSTGLNLSPADTAHSQTVDAPSLIQAHILTISDATHSHSAESLNLGQDISLVVADTVQSQTSETPTLSVEFVLSILDAVHTHSADTLSLATQVTLVVSDALHAHYAAAAAESTMTPAGRVFIVHAEDRVFLILGEDRTFGVT